MRHLPALDRAKYVERAQHSRLVYSHELALERKLVATITSAGKHVARMYRDHGQAGLTQGLGEVKGRLASVLRPALTATAREFAHRLAQHPKCLPAFETKAFEDLDGRVAEVMGQHTARRITGIDESLRQAIANILRRAVEEGWSESEIAAAIEEATSGEMADYRARRIARTETHTAANMGQFAAAEASPFKFTKEWLSTEDARTRADHAAANGQVVDLLDHFVVGGVEMMMPGDPQAPPGQIINCRCTMLLEPILGDMGADERTTPELVVDLDEREQFFGLAEDLGRLPDPVTLYTTGTEIGLPEFASAADIEDQIGVTIDIDRLTGWLDPRLITGNGLQDTFPLFGRPVVVEVSVPEGTKVMGLAPAATEITVLDVTLQITGIDQSRWGEVQDDAGVEIDKPPKRQRYRRLPPKRGVTVVTAEVTT